MLTDIQLAPHRTAVAGALRALERRLEQLTQTLLHGSVRASIDGVGDATAAVARACSAYGTIDLGMDDPVNVSPVCLGVVGAPADVVRLALEVNAAKEHLKAVCAPLQHVRTRVAVREDGRRRTRAIPLTRVVLRAIQRSDLNLLAAYRRIPVLPDAPLRVVYTRAHTRSVYRKSLAEIGELLARSDKPGIEEDRARLRRLAGIDTHLGLVRPRYTNIRANLSFDDAGSPTPRRRQIGAELPLLFPHDPARAWPVIEFPQAEADGTGNRRNRRSRLEATAYLVTLPVHRYLPVDR
jgi:hypothetical protein